MDELNSLAIEAILNEENTDNVFLVDDNNIKYEFEQVALIPYKDDVFAILKPVNPSILNVTEDDAIVFSIKEEDDLFTIMIEEDDNIANEVFEMYLKIMEENN